ncbi:MAG: bile acid:sodium symporter [Planctomycetota bacterium]
MALSLVGGASFDQLFSEIADLPGLRSGLVAAVLFGLAWTLPLGDLRRSIRRPATWLLAVSINVLWVPALAMLAYLLVPSEAWPIDGGEGLLVASLVPSTLASASIWVRRGGGDDSVTMMTTVATNLACPLVVFAGLFAFDRLRWIEASDQAGTPILQLWRLLLIVVLPMFAGQWLRGAGSQTVAERWKPRIKWGSQAAILLMVAFGAARASNLAESMAASNALAGAGFLGATPVQWCVCLSSAVAVHLTALVGGIGVARILGWPRHQQIAVGVGGSQKTLMVGLQITLDCGVSVLPIVIYHTAQLLIDTAVVDVGWSDDRDVGIPKASGS